MVRDFHRLRSARGLGRTDPPGARVVRCVACLDTRECWVCLGEGQLRTGPSILDREPCEACRATGVCPHCARAAELDAEQSSGPTAVSLSRRTWTRAWAGPNAGSYAADALGSPR